MLLGLRAGVWSDAGVPPKRAAQHGALLVRSSALCATAGRWEEAMQVLLHPKISNHFNNLFLSLPCLCR